MRAAWWRTNGSLLQPVGTGPAQATNTTVWPEPTWVADTDIACRTPERRLRSIAVHGMFFRTNRSRPPVSTW